MNLFPKYQDYLFESKEFKTEFTFEELKTEINNRIKNTRSWLWLKCVYFNKNWYLQRKPTSNYIEMDEFILCKTENEAISKLNKI